MGLYQVALSASMFAQLAADHAHRLPEQALMISLTAGLVGLIVSIEFAIEMRKPIIEEAQRWTEYPEHVPSLKHWRIPFLIFAPLYAMCFLVPVVNIPYLYRWYALAVGWIFSLGFVGEAVAGLAALLGLKLVGGSILYGIRRLFEAIRRAPEDERFQ